MKTRYFLLSAALVIATLLTGCNTEEILKLNNIQVSNSFVGIEMDGGSQTIDVTANGSWAIEAFDADWLTVSPTSGGAGKTTVTFSAGPSANDRDVELKLTCGNETQYINVVQPGDPSLKPKYDDFKEGDYWIMFNNGGTWIAATPVPEGSTYGYLYAVDAIVSGGELSSTAANAFTFKKVDGGFTIQDSFGRFYYMSGTYTSCNVAAEMPASGAVWTVEQTGDYEFYVTNANGKWMQFSTGYSSMGVYDAPQAGGLLPYLVEMGEPPVEPLVLKTDDVVDMPQGGGAFTTSILCLGDGLEFSIPIDAQDWLGVVVSSIDADTTTVIVNVAENAGNNRSADITFSTNYNDNVYTATVTVNQTGAITPATVGEVNAAPDDEAKLYRVQGYISSVNNLAKGRFNIKDYSGEIYAFNIAAKPGGSTDLSAILHEGDVVTIVGYKTSFQGKNELMGYLESYYHVEEVTIEKFLAAEDAADVFYRITGVVTNGAGTTPGGVTKKFDLTNYGNFDLVDETGSVYVYGVLTGLNGEKGKFGTLGVNEGDELTIVAAKKTYKDLVEADPTWYVSHTPADVPEPGPDPVNAKGTLENPFLPSEIATALLAGENFEEDVYIKGKVSTILYSYSAQYGTTSFWLSDDGKAYGVSEDKKFTTEPAKDFECYGLYFFGGEAWTEGHAQVAVGDEVVVVGKVTAYTDFTETVNKKAHLYSVNGATTDANGLGNAEFPFNNAGIHAFIDAAEAARTAATEAGEEAPVFPDVCVKGKISSILYPFSAQYGTATFWISDDGKAYGVSEDKKTTTDTANDFECYGLYFFGNQSWVEGNSQIEVGDEVVVKGQYQLFKGTYETSNKKAWLLSRNGATE